MNKILIVGPSWVGDMVMAQCLFKLLKQGTEPCQIDVLAPAWSNALLTRMPEVAQTFTLNIGHGEFALKKRIALAKLLREQRYDLAIVLPNSFKSALIPWLAGIPRRRGWRGEWRYGLLNEFKTLDKLHYPLMVDRFGALADNILAKAQHVPRPALVVSENGVLAALDKYQLSTEKKILTLCPGAEFGPAKRWPPLYYAEVAQHYLNLGWQVWLFGSAKDQEVTQIIQAQTANQCIDLAGKTSLAEAIDLMSLAHKVVSNDSGLMHIASALNRPLVVPYGSTSSGFTPPLADNVQILSLQLACSPCFKRECPLQHLNCLNEMKPDIVIDALNKLEIV